MCARPARFRRALTGLATVLAVAGCAGTAPSPAAGAGTSARSTTGSGTVPQSPERPIVVEIAGGQVSGHTGRVPVVAGTRATLLISSDVADEVHVHGYDVTADVAPGRPAEISVDATIPGVFEVELHRAGTVLLTLQVE